MAKRSKYKDFDQQQLATNQEISIPLNSFSESLFEKESALRTFPRDADPIGKVVNYVK